MTNEELIARLQSTKSYTAEELGADEFTRGRTRVTLVGTETLRQIIIALHRGKAQ